MVACNPLTRSLAPGRNADSVTGAQVVGVNANRPACQVTVPSVRIAALRSIAKLKRVWSAAWAVSSPPRHTRSRKASVALGRPPPDKVSAGLAVTLSGVATIDDAVTRSSAPLAPSKMSGPDGVKVVLLF